MANAKNPVWNYNGDMSIEQGGFYWREDGADDYVCAVRVTPCSDGGGPGNLFLIESGSIHIGAKADRVAALACIGTSLSEATRDELVYSALAYRGIEADISSVVRVGPVDPFWDNRGDGWNPKPDDVLRSNVNLRNYIKREFFGLA